MTMNIHFWLRINRLSNNIIINKLVMKVKGRADVQGKELSKKALLPGYSSLLLYIFDCLSTL